MSSAHPKPRLVPGFDIRSLPIGPTEAFILSRVDGSAKVDDLALSTGLTVAEVQGHLERLASLGCIQLGEPRPLPNDGRIATPRPDARREPTYPAPVAVTPSPPAVSAPPNGLTSVSLADDTARVLDAGVDPALLDEAPDVARETKILILNLHARYEDVDHYALLGVPRSADKKDIKAAYFALVNQFHADRFFGKELGAYKARIDRIFGAVTKAHDTLTRSKTRDDYDAYLKSREATHDLESPRPATRRTPPAREVPLATPQSPRFETPRSAARPPYVREDDGEPERSPLVPTSPAPAPTGDQSLPFVPRVDTSSAAPPSLEASSGEIPQPSARTLDADSARRMMARKLLGNTGQRQGDSLRPPRPAADATPDEPLGRELVQQAVRDDLMQRLAGRSAPAERYRQIADDAEKSGNLASALNALRAVADLSPDDAALQERIARLQLEIDRSMADRFVEQGKYEERDRQWDKAARSFERAARGKSSSELYARAADCKVRAGTDARKAVELARMSVNLAPDHARRHLLLARAFEAAGMTSSALGSAKRALELDPKLDDAKALMKDLKK